MAGRRNRNTKIGWTVEEETYLEKLCKGQTKPDWKYISSEINSVFESRSRSSKQCRQRFHNYIRYHNEDAFNSAWQEKEDAILLSAYIEIGSKWAQISKRIPGRSQNCIKNRFYGQIRKFLRIINDVLRESAHRNRKPIKQHMLTKILSKEELAKQEPIIPQTHSPTQQAINVHGSDQFLSTLKFNILKHALQPSQEVEKEELMGLLEGIHRFNVLAKGDNIRENRKGRNRKRKTLPPLKNRQNGNEDNHYHEVEHEEEVRTLNAIDTEPPRQSTKPEMSKLESSPILKDSYMNELHLQIQFDNGPSVGQLLHDQMNQFFSDMYMGAGDKYDHFQFQ